MISAFVALALSVAASVPSPPSEPAPIPEGYVPLIDSTGVLVIAVPEAWTDIDPEPAVRDGIAQPYIAASPDLAAFLDSFDAPGAMYAAFPFTAEPLDLVRAHGVSGGCATLEVKTYDDPVFTGVVQVGNDCGTTHMTWNMVVASPADESFTAVVQVQSAPDDEATQIVLLTFNVAPGTVPAFSPASTDPTTTVQPATG